jgi:hypothetical protein
MRIKNTGHENSSHERNVLSRARTPAISDPHLAYRLAGTARLDQKTFAECQNLIEAAVTSCLSLSAIAVGEMLNRCFVAAELGESRGGTCRHGKQPLRRGFLGLHAQVERGDKLNFNL